MNKKVLVVVVVSVVIVAAAAGICYFTTNNNTVQPRSVTADQTQNEAENKTGNELVQDVLDKVKAETPTVQSVYVVTEATDSNNLLGKKGEYQYAGSFYDTRTGYQPVDENGNQIDISKDNYGTDAGGTIEVFASEADAVARGEYLEQFQSGAITAGAYKVNGNVVLRVSSNYTATQQQEMLKVMESAL